MKLKALNGVRVLMSTDGNDTLYLDIGTALIPITTQAGGSVVDPEGLIGEDGGYYTPNVNTVTGYVTWTPSKDSMPAIAPANIRGPAGKDGRGVRGIDISVDSTGAITGGTVYYDDGAISKLTFSLSEQ